MATNMADYEVDLEDERLQAVDDKWEGISNEVNSTYQDRIDNADNLYQGLIDENNRWAEEQSRLQQEQTDFTIEQIEQQKEQAHKDYLKEQSGAYKDWQKQSDQYGVNAEQMAASGMTNTGFSESSQVAMYNQYQNRIAVARESHNLAVLNYNNAMKEARLQNSSILAEIAHKAYEQQEQFIVESVMYKDGLIAEQMNKKIELENMRSNEWFKVLDQINHENAMKFEADQAELNRQFQTKEAELDRAHDLKIQELDQTFEEKMAEIEQNYKIAYLNAQTEKEKELIDKQHEKDMAKLAQQLENEKALLDKKLANDKAYLDYQRQTSGGNDTITKGGSTGGGRGGSLKSTVFAINKDDGGTSSKNQVNSNTWAGKPLNRQSITALGRGMISDADLAKLVKSGQVVMYEKNGQMYFKNDPSSAHRTAIMKGLGL